MGVRAAAIGWASHAETWKHMRFPARKAMGVRAAETGCTSLPFLKIDRCTRGSSGMTFASGKIMRKCAARIGWAPLPENRWAFSEQQWNGARIMKIDRRPRGVNEMCLPSWEWTSVHAVAVDCPFMKIDGRMRGGNWMGVPC